MDDPEIRDVGDAPKLGWRHLANRREHRHHRVVDPDLDRTELAFHPRGGGVHPRGIGDVALEHERTSARVFDLALRGLETIEAARDQTDPCAAGRELADRRAADSG